MMRTLQQTAVVLLLMGLSACVVPVGPEWTDPERNSPPRIESALPSIGSVLSVDADADLPLLVSVVLADQNSKDKLYVRWIIDYPPFSEEITRVALTTILPGGDTTQRPTLYFAPNCSDHRIAPGFSNHRLLLAASDSPFASDDPNPANPDAVSDGSFPVEGAWQFKMDCP
jgi:hypothetical protein